MATIKKHTRGTVQQRTHVGTAHQQSKEENYEPITAAEKQSITVYAWAVELFSWWRLVVYSRNVVIYIILILSYILVVRCHIFFFAIITINIDFFFYCENSTLLRDQTEARRAEKIFWDRPPIPGPGWPPPPPYLKVWICHCSILSYFTCAPLVLDSDRQCPLDWAILLVHKENKWPKCIKGNIFINSYFVKNIYSIVEKACGF